MTFPRKLGALLVVVAVVATAGHFLGWAIPSLRWFFSFAADPADVAQGSWRERQAEVAGVAMCGAIALVGLVLIVRGGGFQWNPLTLRKLARFRSIGRGHGSFVLLMVLVVLALLDQALVGKRALAVNYDGAWYFPAFVQQRFSEADFGGEGEEEADYRELKERLEDEGGRVILPPVPWEPTLDSDDKLQRPLDMVEGRAMRDGELFSGFATQFQRGAMEVKVRSSRIREGVPNGPAMVYGPDGEIAGRETWRKGELVATTKPDGVELAEAGPWVEEIYPPLPPSWERRHFLGTDSKGWDVLAQLYGGLQVALKASVLYLALTYGVGIALGAMMGYFGGWFDLVMQRVMEVMSNVPFLLVVMILIANLGRDAVGLGTILLIFGIFSWIGVAIYLRTSTYKEKARDYALAARVLGAGTGRIIFRHILPNAVATIVTLVPFSVAAVISSLTALDFLGFGLPDTYPSWGRMLDDGLSNLSAPWVVTSVFGTMVVLLLLITFIGEAVREATDPKKFTTYR